MIVKLQTNDKQQLRPIWQRSLIVCAAMFRHWDDEKERHWLEAFNRGFNRFVLVKGIGIYGSIVCLPLIYLTLTMAKSNELNNSIGAAILTTILCSIIGGIVFGVLAWFGTVYSYEQYLEQKKAPQNRAN